VAGAVSHGWDLDGVDIVELVADSSDLDVDAQVTMYHPSEVELHDTTRRVLEAVERINPARVVFDSLSELRLLAQNSLRYRRQILALKQFFIGRRCTVLLLDDKTGQGAVLQLHSIAHGVLSLEQLSPAYGNARRRLRVVKYRGTTYRGGYHDFTIGYEGLSVFPRLVAAEHSQPFAHSSIKSGVAALDQLLGGGPDRGTSTLLMGPAGTGKSTVAMQYAVSAADRGDPAVVFAFDEGLATLETRTTSLGIPLSAARAAGQLTIKQVDPAEMSPGEFAFYVRQEVETRSARLIVIDSLNGYFNAMPDERSVTMQLHELLSYLGHRGVTTILVMAQHGVPGVSLSAPIDSSYLADSVVLFRHFETEGKLRKAISVLKKRTGFHEESIREMSFDAQGIHLSQPLAQFRGVFSGFPSLSPASPVDR
jgi:circadian clock protein KaiC